MPLTIPVLGEALGRSVLPDEYTGAYAHAHRLAERVVRAATADQVGHAQKVQALAP